MSFSKPFRDLPIKWKVACTIFFCTIFAGLCSIIIGTMLDQRALLRSLVEKARLNTSMMSQFSEIFLSLGPATDLTFLEPGFNAIFEDSDVEGIVIYGLDGDVLIQKSSAKTTQWTPPEIPKEEIVISQHAVEVFATVLSNGKTVGYVLIRQNTSKLYDRLKEFTKRPFNMLEDVRKPI